MIAGLETALEHDPAASVHVRLDSKLVVEQMTGRWKIKHPDMQVLARRASALIAGRDVSFEWVPRLSNKRADAAANESMDRRESFRRDLDAWTGLTARAGSSSVGRATTSLAAVLGADGAERDRITLTRGGPERLGRRCRGGRTGALGVGRHPALVRRSARRGRAGGALSRPAPVPRDPARFRARRLRCRRFAAAALWDVTPFVEESDLAPTLFDLGDSEDRSDRARRAGSTRASTSSPASARRSRARPSAGRLRLLTAAESAGALIAVELRTAGLPWDAATHETLLTDVLGERVAGGAPQQARRMPHAGCATRWATRPRAWTRSPSSCGRCTGSAILAESTSRWELAEYGIRSSSRSWSTRSSRACSRANGWSWLAEWVHDGRFRPVYVPGGRRHRAVGVVRRGSAADPAAAATRRARRPRLGARGRRRRSARAARAGRRCPATWRSPMPRGARTSTRASSRRGVVSRAIEAKIAMLGAMYGATTGDSGRLVPSTAPHLPARDGARRRRRARRRGRRRRLDVARAARVPPPSADVARGAVACERRRRHREVDENRARRWARDRGRFTRNFVVQGTAAEWALAWLADLRRPAGRDAAGRAGGRRPGSGPRSRRRAHLVVLPPRRGHRPRAGRRTPTRSPSAVREAAAARRPSAVRRLPDRLPARPAHRGGARRTDAGATRSGRRG